MLLFLAHRQIIDANTARSIDKFGLNAKTDRTFMKPQTEQALLERAQQIAGLTLGELAAELHHPVPPNLKRDKGWVGTLIEIALGANAGSKAEQDFLISALS